MSHAHRHQLALPKHLRHALALLGLALALGPAGQARAGEPPAPSEAERERLRKAAVVDDEPDCEPEIRAAETEREGINNSLLGAAVTVTKRMVFEAKAAADAYWDAQGRRWEDGVRDELRARVSAAAAVGDTQVDVAIPAAMCRVLAKRQPEGCSSAKGQLPVFACEVLAHALAAAGDPTKCRAAGELEGLCRGLVSEDWSGCSKEGPIGDVCRDVPRYVAAGAAGCKLKTGPDSEMESCLLVTALGVPKDGLAACAGLRSRPQDQVALALQTCEALATGKPERCPETAQVPPALAQDPNATSFARAAVIAIDERSQALVGAAGLQPAYCYVGVDVVPAAGGAPLARVETVLRTFGGDSPTFIRLDLPERVNPFEVRTQVESHCVRCLTW